MADVRLSAAAVRDLGDIAATGIRDHGEERCAAYLLGFDRAFALLRRQPFAGEARPEFTRAMRSLSHRPYRILYRVEGETVLIDRILHQARDVRRALRDQQ